MFFGNRVCRKIARTRQLSQAAEFSHCRFARTNSCRNPLSGGGGGRFGFIRGGGSFTLERKFGKGKGGRSSTFRLFVSGIAALCFASVPAVLHAGSVAFFVFLA